MRKRYFALAVALTALLLTACAPKAGGEAAILGKEFSLLIGESVAIKGENLEITFLKVLEDSRCPKGVQCVWQGRAKSLVRFVSKNTTELELTEPGLTDSLAQYTFQDYYITFRLLPYPEAGREITADQYRLQMTINKLK